MNILKHFAFLSLAATGAIASYIDFNFGIDSKQEICVQDHMNYSKTYYADGKVCSSNFPGTVRTRIINPKPKKGAEYTFDLHRPFFIIDGIYLSTDGVRTLSDMQNEIDQVGMIQILEELGYTPVLVQFGETVQKSLEQNSKYFAELLKFINSNAFFEFPDRAEEGVVVLGISQGGILGRYGSYLYDKSRTKKDAPVRLFASLDSPHQGAIMPLGLFYTINFWATDGGAAAAEAFRDLIDGDGASGLLLYDYDKSAKERKYKINTGTNRFLFGKYRDASKYKGFPAVLVAQGQLNGTIPKHADYYYRLKRKGSIKYILSSKVVARAESELGSFTDGKGEIFFSRIYKKGTKDVRDKSKEVAKYDFIQGSTYPFAETMYYSLRKGFSEAMPHGKKLAQIAWHKVGLSVSMDKDELNQKNSTFIPTASAIDLSLGEMPLIMNDLAFKQTSTNFPFTNPSNRSSANAVYAVDPTHPRYNEPISGRHIEMPIGENAANIAKGWQVDIWRILCEVANYDYDNTAKAFRNDYLSWYFTPNANCMDQTKIPQILKTGGYMLKKNFAYARYDYNEKATENNASVTFDVPAGWHKSAIYDNGSDIAEGTTFEIDVKVNSSKGNWLKAELLLNKGKNGATQLQLNEISIPLDGKTHKIRWQMPAAKGALEHYRWFRLVLNSNGSNVTVGKASLTKNAVKEIPPTEEVNANVYPNATYKLTTWTQSVKISDYSGDLGKGVQLQFEKIGGGAYIDFAGAKNMNRYNVLKVSYWPGTCQGTGVYFDSYKKGYFSLSNARIEGNFAVAEIPLSSIINTDVTPENKKSAFRLTFENKRANDKCIVNNILLY